MKVIKFSTLSPNGCFVPANEMHAHYLVQSGHLCLLLLSSTVTATTTVLETCSRLFLVLQDPATVSTGLSELEPTLALSSLHHTVWCHNA